MDLVKACMLSAVLFAAGAAVAQTTTSETTTTTVTPRAAAAPMVAPPVGTLSTSRTERTVGPDGTKTDKSETTYRNSNGVANDSVSTTVVTPPAKETTTSTTSTTVTKTPNLVPVAPPINRPGG